MTSIATLESWKPSGLSTLADQINADRRALLDLSDEIHDGRPPATWCGDDAVVAGHAHVGRADRVVDHIAELSAVVTALDTACTDITAAKTDLAEAMTQAKAKGFTVNRSTGEVSDDQDYDTLGELFLAQIELGTVTGLISDALTDGDTADRALATVLDNARLAKFDLDIGSDGSDFTDVMDELEDAVVGTPPADPARRAAQVAAFEDLLGRPPVSISDWTLAEALDSTSYQDKNGETDAVIQIGQITPRPGLGLVRLALFIPSEDVFNVPNYDIGDNRGFDPNFDPEQSRVSIYVDYETGTVVARQNPSVDSEGEVRVQDPNIRVSELNDGQLMVNYDAENPFAPPDPTNSHTVNGSFVVRPAPFGDGPPVRVDGTIGDYPALEMYHDAPDGTTSTLVQDRADNEGDYGPLLELPNHHDIGVGTNEASTQFYEWRPVSGDVWERHGGVGSTQLGDEPERVTPGEPNNGGSGPHPYHPVV